MDKYKIPGVKTFEFTKIIGLDKISFGHDIIIDDFVFLYATASMEIGNYVHISCFASITGGAEFTIGDFSGISLGCRILTGTDDYLDWGFGHPASPEKYRNVKREPVHIGKFSNIGANSVIFPGVTIGEGASVGANSVVTRDLDPWTVYIGNKKYADRNKEAILKNYHRFLEETGSAG